MTYITPNNFSLVCLTGQRWVVLLILTKVTTIDNQGNLYNFIIGENMRPLFYTLLYIVPLHITTPIAYPENVDFYIHSVW